MLALMQSVKAVEQLTIEAVVTRSATLAWKAIALHPLVDSVEVGRDLLERYRQGIPGVGAALSDQQGHRGRPLGSWRSARGTMT